MAELLYAPGDQVTEGAELLKLPVRANARPALDLDIVYDGTAGVHLPMPFTMNGVASERNAPTCTSGRNGTSVRATSQAAPTPSTMARHEEPSAKTSVVRHRRTSSSATE